MSALLPLRLSDVTFEAGGRTILDRVSAEIGAGPVSVILGANGAGKSVLMRICHGLLAPSAGEVRWSAVEEDGAPRRQAMVFQRPVMLRRTALANVEYALKAAQVPRTERRKRALDALRHVGLERIAGSPARLLSGGEQQRLALARVLLQRPDWLLIDDATSALDEPLEERVYRELRKSLPGATTISIAHRPSDVLRDARTWRLVPEGAVCHLRAD